MVDERARGKQGRGTHQGHALWCIFGYFAYFKMLNVARFSGHSPLHPQTNPVFVGVAAVVQIIATHIGPLFFHFGQGAIIHFFILGHCFGQIAEDQAGGKGWFFQPDALANLGQNLPIGTGFANRLDGGVVPLHAPFAAGEGAFPFGPALGRQNDIGLCGRFCHEQLLHDQKVQLAPACHQAIANGVGSQNKHRFQVAILSRFVHLCGSHAWSGDGFVARL